MKIHSPRIFVGNSAPLFENVRECQDSHHCISIDRTYIYQKKKYGKKFNLFHVRFHIQSTTLCFIQL